MCFLRFSGPPLARRLVVCVGIVAALAVSGGAEMRPIDRRAVVTRHNPKVTSVDPWAPLSVGNGQFAFTVDATGLQTFYDHYQKNGIGLETQARWAWHSAPNPRGYKLEDANRPFESYGRTIGYPVDMNSPAGQWLRQNPHPMPLGLLGLDYVHADGRALALEEVRDIDQTLDLWTGTITSRYTIDGEPVKVVVACARGNDIVAVRIESRLLATGRLGVRLAFPRGHDMSVKNNPALDWGAEGHTTETDDEPMGGVWVLRRAKDEFRCVVAVYGAALRRERDGPHAFRVRPTDRQAEVLDFVVGYSAAGLPLLANAMPGEFIRQASAREWEAFWQSGGAIDFSGSKDPRAAELERRVVLSQYLTAIQCVADFPPQETGLTLNSWYGKHHTEMIWWHGAHFALWGRDALLEKNLQWFVNALPVAREIAASRELRGARWPKMIGPGGRESPGGNPMIVWNQPHPIHLAELLYRNSPTPETLERYRELVFETAECMASMLNWDEANQRYNLGPPLWIAQEIYDQAKSMNPAYELSYWVRGLKIAQQWRERLKLARSPEWDRRIEHIAKLPQKDGKYVAIESNPDTWDNVASRHDHPSFLMALGQLPGDGVDRATMNRTLDAVLADWDWETKIWGWDYPMIAMTAARLGRPEDAVDILLKDGPNNGYTPNGHNRQREDLPIYLPGNGSLLAAVAMMAAGWDDAPDRNAPGFPQDGSWVVRSEGLRPLP